MLAALIPIRIWREKGTAWHGDCGAKKFADGRLWIAPGSPLTDGDARAVRLDDCANDNAGSDDPAGLRVGGQRYVARLRAGNGGHSSGGAVHQPLRALLRVARIALHVRVEDPASLAGRHGGV